MKNLKQ